MDETHFLLTEIKAIDIRLFDRQIKVNIVDIQFVNLKSMDDSQATRRKSGLGGQLVKVMS